MKIPDVIEELRKLNIGIKIKNGNLVLSGGKDKLSKELLNEIKNYKPALIDYIKGYEKSSKANTNNEKDEDEYFPLTAQQKSIWLASQNPQTATLYNQPSMFIAQGDLNIDAFRHSINKIIETHESLRTGFYENNGEPLQKVLKQLQVTADLIELKKNESPAEIYKKLSSYVFDLSKPPLLNCTIVKENES